MSSIWRRGCIAPGGAAPDPLTPRRPRKGRKRSAKKPQANPPSSAPGGAVADPFVQPPATAPVDPAAGAPPGLPPTPANPPAGIPGTSASPPSAAPRGLPGDSGITPPVGVPAPPAPKASAVTRQVPVLSQLPLIGRLFRSSAPARTTTSRTSIGKIPVLPATRRGVAIPPANPRGVPGLENIPILGRLFRTTPAVIMKPSPSASNSTPESAPNSPLPPSR